MKAPFGRAKSVPPDFRAKQGPVFRVMACANISSMLRDRVGAGAGVLFVGINPGIRSAAIGHHFAGYSNRFWKLLYDARLTPERIRAEEDARLPEWGLGITNLIARMTPGIDTLEPHEYPAGLVKLRRKVRRWKPKVVAFVGVSLYRVIFNKKGPVACGLQEETFEGARVFVLPNPSGRNANFTYAEMLAAFKQLTELHHREHGEHRARTKS